MSLRNEDRDTKDESYDLGSQYELNTSNDDQIENEFQQSSNDLFT